MIGCVLLPSLDRPHLVKQFFDSYLATKASVPVWVIVDKNDPKKEQYMKLDYPKGCILVLTDAVTMGDKCRELWDRYCDFDYVFICNDDHVGITEQWDQKVISQINGTNVVSTNDNWVAPNRICGAICFSGGVLRTLGYMFLPKQHHLFSDDAWSYLFTRSQSLHTLMDVVVEHRHAYKHPELQDETFKKINGPLGLVTQNGTSEGVGGFWPHDKQVIEEWFKSGTAEKDLSKIIALQPKTGLMIATPSHDGNVFINYALGLCDTAIHLSQHGVYFEMARVVGSSLIPHARNSLVDMFLKSKCQRLLMIDSDQGFDKSAVLHLFQSPKLIIAGITPHKRFPMNLNFEPLQEDNKYFSNLTNKGIEEFRVFQKDKADQLGIIEVNRVGTGFIMIDRKAFEIMKDHVSDYEPFDDRPEVKHLEYFWMGGGKVDQNKRYLGEDWNFCRLAKKLNIPIYINANAIVTHHGSMTFGA